MRTLARATLRLAFAFIIISWACSGLAQRAEQTIVLIDPALRGVTAPKPGEKSELEIALKRLAAATPHSDLARLELEPGEKLPSAGRLAVMVRELIALKYPNIVVENVGVKTVRILSRGETSAARNDQHAAKTIFLLFDTATGANSLSQEERFEDLQNEQAQLLLSLPPARLQNPMMAWMQRIQGHSKEEIERAMAPLQDAGMKVWENNSADQRAQMMKEAMEVMQSFGSGAATAPAGRNYLPELRSAVAAVARKSGCEILVEPGIFVSKEPEVKPEATITEILDGLAGAASGLTWRAVYLPQSGDQQAFPGNLARRTRWLESQARGAKTISAQGSDFAMAIDLQSAMDMKPMLRGLGLREKPLYLIYAPVSRSGPSEEQFAALQRDQMEQMLRMNPSQLGAALEHAGQLYLSADPASRGKLMGLPVMAAMMAVWMPRAAKEGR